MNQLRRHSQDGITLLITLLLMGVLLGVTTSLINITLKQYQFAGIAYDSEVAFQAANAGMECIQHWDWNGPATTFAVGQARSSIGCFDAMSNDIATGPATITSGAEQRFQFTRGTPAVCTEMSVFKFFDAGAPVQIIVRGTNMRPGDPCPQGAECTFIESRGYNVACNQINQSARVVEREYTVLY